MNIQVLVIAKQPVSGQVKTRLCPPCTADGAAAVAAAALADTLEVVDSTPVAVRTLVVSGRYEPPPGWLTTDQRGAGLAQRLANGFTDTAVAGMPSLLIGMDTPQITPGVLIGVAAGLDHADAVLGSAEDGGWWVLALREPRHAAILRDVPMSTVDTCAATFGALRDHGLTVASAVSLRDVDTAADAHAVARTLPGTRFARAVATHVPAGALAMSGVRR